MVFLSSSVVSSFVSVSAGGFSACTAGRFLKDGFSNSFDGAAEPNIYRGSPGTSLPGFRVPASEAMLPRETGAQENRPLPSRPAFKNLARAVAVRTPRVPLSSLWAEGQPLPKSLLRSPGENDRRGRPIKASRFGRFGGSPAWFGLSPQRTLLFLPGESQTNCRPVSNRSSLTTSVMRRADPRRSHVIAGRTSSGRTVPFA